MRRPCRARCSRRSCAPGRKEVPVSESIKQPSTSKTQQSAAEVNGAGSVGSSLARRSEDIIGILYYPCSTLGIGGSDSGISAKSFPDSPPAGPASPAGVTLTFGELAGRAHRLVHGLRARGLQAGDIFAYALPNDVDMLCWQLAAQEGGCASIALNPALSAGAGPRVGGPSPAGAVGR